MPYNIYSTEYILIDTRFKSLIAIDNMAAPQPDFVNATNGFATTIQGLNTIQNEFSSIANIPAVQNGAAILAQLTVLTNQITATNNQISQLIAR